MQELIQERTATQKVFDMGEGVKQYVVTPQGRPIHYKKDGLWLPYESNVDNGKVIERSYYAEILEDKIGYKGVDKTTGKELYLELEGTWSQPKVVGNEVTYTDVHNETDFILHFQNDCIKALIKLKSDKAPRTFKYMINNRDTLNVGWDSTGRAIKMKVKKEDGVIYQTFLDEVLDIDKETRVRSWSKDVKYPVVIDPTNTFSVDASVNSHSGRMIRSVVGGSSGVYNLQINSNSCLIGVSTTGTGGSSNTQRTHSPYMIFKVNGIAAGTPVTSAALSIRMKWKKYTSGGGSTNVQPNTVNDKFKVHLYNQFGPTSASVSNQYDLAPQQSATTANRPVYMPNAHSGGSSFAVAYSGIDQGWTFDTSSAAWRWRTKSIDVTSAVNAYFNTSSFDHTLNNDMLFVFSSLQLVYSAIGTGSPFQSGEELRLAQRQHAGQADPTLTIVTGAGAATTPMKIIFA